jgi:Rod binding domain-containing protein
MPVSSINAGAKVNPADVPLEKLATSKALSEEQKTSEMTRQFEAMLLRQILNEAQKSTFKSKFASSGVSTAIYQDLMVNQLADKISSSRTVGLSQELETQVSRQSPHGKHAPAHAAHESQNQTKNVAPPLPLTKAPRL